MNIILIKYKYFNKQPQNAQLTLENSPQKIRKGQQRMQTMHMPNGSHPQIRLDALQKMLQRKCQYHWIHQDQMIIVFSILFLMYTQFSYLLQLSPNLYTFYLLLVQLEIIPPSCFQIPYIQETEVYISYENKLILISKININF